MKKRWISAVLALVLLGSLSVPAAAARTADVRLASVTAQVKQTLGLDTEGYTDFYGDLTEDVLAPSWYLEWSGEEGNLSVSATEEGKILSYNRYDRNETAPAGGSYAPAFPAGDPAGAEVAAKKFLKRVLAAGETAEIELRPLRLDATAYRFTGEILVNGLPAGLSCSLSLRCEDYAVTSFHRDDLSGRVMKGVPSPHAAVTVKQARAALKETLALRLEYVTKEDGQAILRYLPEYGDDYYVDAASGRLVNLTELARDVAAGGGSINDAVAKEESAAAPTLSSGLSKAEQEGADRLKDVLDKDALDRKARSVTELGLDVYTLSGADYTVAREEEESDHPVTAALRYGRQVNDASWRRTVTLDAKTGELLSVSSSAWLQDESAERKVTAAEAEAVAAAFLRRQVGESFEQTALYDRYDAMENSRRVSHSFTYAHKANGYFFPESGISVGVDATDGSISSYGNYFLQDVTFEDPAGIVTAEQALEAWLDTYTVRLGYVRVPTAVDYDRPEYRPLLDYGISYLYRLRLGYVLERDAYFLGIDARSGGAVAPDWTSAEEGIAYSDVSGHWAETEILKLAQYSVGFTGGTFCPGASLTQLDLVALLASMKGYLYDGSSETAADELYEFARNAGLLSEERNDNALLTRADTVRIILDAVGYGPVARLEGIFRAGFADDARIPAGDYGYVALAKGLGMVSGDSAGCFRPNSTATRAQAAVMLHNLMAR